LFPDKLTEREIKCLPVYCSNKRNGCLWQGELNALKQTHEPLCEYERVVCNLNHACTAVLLRKELDHHEEHVCRYRLISCGQCNKNMLAGDKEKHNSECEHQHSDCPYHCGQRVSDQTMGYHMSECAQLMSGNSCPYAVIGCTAKPGSWSNLKDHLDSSINTHSALAARLNLKTRQKQNFIGHLEEEIEALKSVCQVESSKIEELDSRLTEQAKSNKEMRQQFESEKVKMDSKVLSLETRLREVQDISQQLQRLREQVEQAPAAQRGSRDNVSLEDSQQFSQSILSIEKQAAILSANLSDADLKLQLIENTSTNGMLTWKVDNIQYRINQSRTGHMTALHSPPCYSHKFGFKFCLRLYLNGDGLGKGKNVSLFFVLMKGDYDNLLDWPFNKRVTFTLLAPENSKPVREVQETFVPNKTSSSFQKPTKVMNVAAGCPLFLDNKRLDDYISDDSIFLKCVVSDT